MLKISLYKTGRRSATPINNLSRATKEALHSSKIELKENSVYNSKLPKHLPESLYTRVPVQLNQADINQMSKDRANRADGTYYKNLKYPPENVGISATVNRDGLGFNEIVSNLPNFKVDVAVHDAPYSHLHGREILPEMKVEDFKKIVGQKEFKSRQSFYLNQDSPNKHEVYWNFPKIPELGFLKKMTSKQFKNFIIQISRNNSVNSNYSKVWKPILNNFLIKFHELSEEEQAQFDASETRKKQLLDFTMKWSTNEDAERQGTDIRFHTNTAKSLSRFYETFKHKISGVILDPKDIPPSINALCSGLNRIADPHDKTSAYEHPAWTILVEQIVGNIHLIPLNDLIEIIVLYYRYIDPYQSKFPSFYGNSFNQMTKVAYSAYPEEILPMFKIVARFLGQSIESPANQGEIPVPLGGYLFANSILLSTNLENLKIPQLIELKAGIDFIESAWGSVKKNGKLGENNGLSGISNILINFENTPFLSLSVENNCFSKNLSNVGNSHLFDREGIYDKIISRLELLILGETNEEIFTILKSRLSTLEFSDYYFEKFIEAELFYRIATMEKAEDWATFSAPFDVLMWLNNKTDSILLKSVENSINNKSNTSVENSKTSKLHTSVKNSKNTKVENSVKNTTSKTIGENHSMRTSHPILSLSNFKKATDIISPPLDKIATPVINNVGIENRSYCEYLAKSKRQPSFKKEDSRIRLTPEILSLFSEYISSRAATPEKGKFIPYHEKTTPTMLLLVKDLFIQNGLPVPKTLWKALETVTRTIDGSERDYERDWLYPIRFKKKKRRRHFMRTDPLLYLKLAHPVFHDHEYTSGKRFKQRLIPQSATRSNNIAPPEYEEQVALKKVVERGYQVNKWNRRFGELLRVNNGGRALRVNMKKSSWDWITETAPNGEKMKYTTRLAYQPFSNFDIWWQSN